MTRHSGRTSFALLAALALIPACHRGGDAAAGARHADAVPAVVRPGTYDWRVCRGQCSFGARDGVIRSGWIVLDTVPIDVSAYPDSERTALTFGYMFQSREGTPNGCYVLRADQPTIETYAGIAGGALLTWTPSRTADSVRFSTYRSPDAGHEVAVVGSTDGFVGTGYSWGVGAAETDAPTDVVLGVYVGPPDRERCREAARAALAMLRGP